MKLTPDVTPLEGRYREEAILWQKFTSLNAKKHEDGESGSKNYVTLFTVEPL